MNKLRHMAIFAHIVEAGTITNAAEVLQLSKSVVSQHLKSLENELGIVLIKRSTRKHVLTSAGRTFYEYCKEINNTSTIAWQRTLEAKEKPQGYIKITAPNALMDTMIAPAIGQLLIEYPLLEPELIAGDSHLDIMSDNIDLAIRVGNSKASNLKQRKIGAFSDVLCGHFTLLDKVKSNEILYIANKWQGDDISHQFIDMEGKKLNYKAKSKCKTNSFNACLALINEGAGIGLIPDFQFLRSKNLLREVFPNFHLPVNDVYALHPYESHVPLNVKVCIKAIKAQFKKLPEMLVHN